MPELPEIETVCRLMRRTLVDRCLTEVRAFADSIVFKCDEPADVELALTDRKIVAVGRKGKYFWLTLDNEISLVGHLGMSGWVEHLSTDQSPPRFCKLILRTDHSSGIAITDPRRLGRLWLCAEPTLDPVIKKLGLDAYLELPKNPRFASLLGARKAPIKAVLLDQGLFAGIGNYLADEILYHARISPLRAACDLTDAQFRKLRAETELIISIAVDAEADENRFPVTWLFHHRWGGGRGATKIGSHAIVRETVGGRTTAWVPALQK